MLPQIKVYRENDGTGDLIVRIGDQFTFVTWYGEPYPYTDWCEDFEEDLISVLVWQSGPDA